MVLLISAFVVGPGVAEEAAPADGWQTCFALSADADRSGAPAGWRLARKPGTKSASFTVTTEAHDGKPFLRMEADKASASIVTSADGVDLAKTPVMRWRWRADTLPEGGDGRSAATDDQAIGIYVGSGSALSNKSVSYRWDTETPKLTEGNAVYGMGSVKVKWFTLRNKEDARSKDWVVDERNVAEDFMRAWGYLPDKIYISVSSNSQYTGSKAVADLDWIQFVSAASPEGGGRGAAPMSEAR